MEISTELNKEKNIFIVQIRGKYRRPHDGFEAQRFVIDSFSPSTQKPSILLLDRYK